MHKPLTGLPHDSLGKDTGSNNTGYGELRVASRVGGREKYGPLERREIPRAFVARFATKYIKSEPDACWLWQAGKYPRGYGMVNLGRYADRRQHTEYAHRVAYVIAKGNIPQGQVVRHSCDTPACVNPQHLILGTQADNVNDAAVQGHYNVAHTCGVRKLSDRDVHDIRTSYEKNVRLAERYRVSTATISLIRRGLRRNAA